MRDIKIMGGVGAILCSISALPHIGIFIFIGGYVLLGIAYWRLSERVGEKKIFKYIFIALILDLLASIGIFIHLSLCFFSFFPAFPSDFFSPSFIFTILSVWIVASLAGYFFFKGNKIVADKTEEKMFKRAGIYLFIGGLGIVIVAIGTLLAWIGYILLAVAFFSLKEE